MTPKVSIAALIYRSTKFAQWCYDGVRAATPEIASGKAEFYFIANDPTDELLDYLHEHEIPHYVNVNARRTPAELFSLGYAKPEYLHRVYRGWNHAIRCARAPLVCLLNSDHYPAPGWLESMLTVLGEHRRIVAAQPIERWHPLHGVFIGSVVGDYGRPGEFRREALLARAEPLRRDPYRAGKFSRGGVYMPCLFRREDALAAGLFPEGNLARTSFEDVAAYGDAEFFRKLGLLGVQHVTALDAVVYHLQEGEMRE